MNTNTISIPSKLSNVTIIAATLLAIITLELTSTSNTILHIVGLVGMIMTMLIPEKNIKGLRVCLIACIYSAWTITNFSGLIIIPVGIIALAITFPNAKNITYYIASSLIFTNIFLQIMITGGFGDIASLSSLSHSLNGAAIIPTITIIYALGLKVANRDRNIRHVIGAILFGFLIGLLLSVLIARLG